MKFGGMPGSKQFPFSYSTFRLLRFRVGVWKQFITVRASWTKFEWTDLVFANARSKPVPKATAIHREFIPSQCCARTILEELEDWGESAQNIYRGGKPRKNVYVQREENNGGSA